MIAAGAVCLPQLDQGVFDVSAIAVEDAALDADSLAHGLGSGQHVLTLARQAHREVRTDGLRRRLSTGSGAHGVAAAPRSTMSHRYPSAQFSTVIEWS